jgi:polyhydroxyalkanoate synthesis regulator phasin
MFTRKLIASTVAAATLASGGLAVAALNPLSSAGAQEQQEQPATATDQARRPGRGVLSDVLGDLVTDGTLTQAQADAVTNGVKDQLKDRRHDRRGNRREVAKVVADTIGISPQDLVADLKAGKSIAEVAQAHDVDPKAVADAIVSHATQRIDQAVTDGKLSAERAAKLKERLPEIADRIVNHHRDA